MLISAKNNATNCIIDSLLHGRKRRRLRGRNIFPEILSGLRQSGKFQTDPLSRVRITSPPLFRPALWRLFLLQGLLYGILPSTLNPQHIRPGAALRACPFCRNPFCCFLDCHLSRALYLAGCLYIMRLPSADLIARTVRSPSFNLREPGDRRDVPDNLFFAKVCRDGRSRVPQEQADIICRFRRGVRDNSGTPPPAFRRAFESCCEPAPSSLSFPLHQDWDCNSSTRGRTG